ncbi:uncharacterized protein METZ01_LOCUS399530 [marine metagenome]|uniref:Uncharacterized protein n=1 Tax=marine metagenome TaxID=408172 RepID=A0A382VJF9_9ZZZZ
MIQKGWGWVRSRSCAHIFLDIFLLSVLVYYLYQKALEPTKTHTCPSLRYSAHIVTLFFGIRKLY